MGMLFNLATEERVLLRAHHVFGRSETRADTCIPFEITRDLRTEGRYRPGAAGSHQEALT